MLKLTNSSLFGFARVIATLSEAGNALGTSPLTGLVLTSCTGRWFQSFGAQDPEERKRAWELSIASALSAQLLARLSGAVDPHRAYTAGLLQDIGELCIARFLPEEAAAVTAAIARGEDRLLAERATLGLDHAEIGARLAEQWGLPAALVDAIRMHHEPERSKQDPLLATYVGLGHQMALCLVAPHRAGDWDSSEHLAAAGFVPAEIEVELIARLAAARNFVDCA